MKRIVLAFGFAVLMAASLAANEYWYCRTGYDLQLDTNYQNYQNCSNFWSWIGMGPSCEQQLEYDNNDAYEAFRACLNDREIGS